MKLIQAMRAGNHILRFSLLASWRQLVRNTSKLALLSGLRAGIVVCTPILLSTSIGLSS
ncbi:MAG: hypothetical protein JO270_24125, partial [Acidobacteriaceae bacterium]|nr:hypothetical protein [Acidobacteriaceae bacterium]